MKTRITILMRMVTWISLGLIFLLFVPSIALSGGVLFPVWFLIVLFAIALFITRKIMQRRLTKNVLENINMTLDHHNIKRDEIEVNMKMMVQKDRSAKTIKKFQEGDLCWHKSIDVKGRLWSEKARQSTVVAVAQGYKLVIIETDKGKLEVAPTYALEKR